MNIISPTRPQNRHVIESYKTPIQKTPQRAGNPAVGTIFEGYRIDRLLGRGGAGVVYAGWDLARHRPAAIKILGMALSQEKQFTRFCRESSTVARLTHPGIIEIYEMGQTEEVCFLAMQLVEGITLREWLQHVPEFSPESFRDSHFPAVNHSTTQSVARTIRFNPSQMPMHMEVEGPESISDTGRPQIISSKEYEHHIVQLLLNLTQSLAHAHSHHVIHRDLKPENIMIRQDGSTVIIDFGLARSFADMTITTQSALIGTPLYMSPEQLQGKPATAASDVYAIGLIGYELLSMSVPFRAKTMEGLLREVLYKPAPPLTGRNPSVSIGLANILHRAMAKDPAERYPTAKELHDELERFAAGKLVTAKKYRYRFDCADVIATRPKRIAIAAYGNLGLSGIIALVAVMSITNNIKITAFTGCISTIYLFLTWWFYNAKRGAKLAGSAVSMMSIIFGMIYLYALKTSPYAWYTTVMFSVNFFAVALFTLFVLFSKRSKTWLQQVQNKRKEFEADRV